MNAVNEIGRLEALLAEERSDHDNCRYNRRQNLTSIKRLESEITRLATVLNRYVSTYPAFRMKPIGADRSPARIEQENLMALEDAARQVLNEQWWRVPRQCAQCGTQFLPNVKAQTFCEVHRYLAGTVIRHMSNSSGSRT